MVLAGPLLWDPVGRMLVVLMAGADGSTKDTTAANLSPRNRMVSVTFCLAASGKYGDASESDRTPMVAASSGRGAAHKAGSRYRSTSLADAT